ncbi:MAG: hypothetical protein Q9198_004622 [Flavoplaca austrocitrina]
MAVLAPIIIDKQKFYGLEENFHRINRIFVAQVMEASYAEAGCSQVIRDWSIQIVDELYDVLHYLDPEFDGLMSYAPTHLKDTGETNDHPFEKRLGFAARYGRHEYLAQYLSSNNPSPGDIKRLVSCAISGWAWRAEQDTWLPESYTLTCKGLLRVLLEYIPLNTDPHMLFPHDSKTKVDRESKWATFATMSFEILDFEMSSKRITQHRLEIITLWKDVVKVFFNYDASADPNIVMLFSFKNPTPGTFLFEESLLSYLERVMPRCKDPVSKAQVIEVENLVRFHGGRSFRRSYSFYGRKMRHIIMTDEQSDRILRNVPLEYRASHRLCFPCKTKRRMPRSPTQSDFEEAAAFVARVEESLPIMEE